MFDLAVVIPAYKSSYLDEALSSLASQTNKNFEVYVGDDASPFDIPAICDKYRAELNLHYHRFDTNVGGKDLVKQWERCVSLIRPTKWLWLFSDDDIAGPGCVDGFYRALENTNEYYDVYRFNITVIDQHGSVIAETPDSPTVENSMSLAYNILVGLRGNSMPEHIFRYSKYIELKGFVNFAFAQAADWATSINFAYEKGLYTIAGAKVKWRKSEESISTLASKRKHLMIFGHLQFLEWVNARFNEIDEKKYNLSRAQIRDASILNLRHIFETHYRGIPYQGFLKVVKKISAIYKMDFWHAAALCMKINYKLELYNLKVFLKPVFIKAGLMKR